MDKPILRKLMIEKRHEYMEEDKKNSNKIIFDKLKNILTQYENIGSYYNFDDEVDTVNINNWILANNKNLLDQTIDGLRTLKPFEYVGEYQNGTSYKTNQLVSLNNNLYLSKEDNNTTTPPSDK